MKCSKHHKYKELTEINNKGLIVFKQHPTQDQSSTLFMLLYDALGPVHDKITVDAITSDGNHLMSQLEHYFLKKDTSVTNKEQLLMEFNNITREKTEEYSTFTTRYVKKLRELKLNEVQVPVDDETKAYKFLIALDEPILKTNICLEIGSKPEWFKKMTYDKIADKAAKYMKHYNNLSKVKQSPRLPKLVNKPKVIDNKNGPKDDHADDKQNQLDKQIQNYMKLLKNVNDKEAYLNKV